MNNVVHLKYHATWTYVCTLHRWCNPPRTTCQLLEMWMLREGILYSDGLWWAVKGLARQGWSAWLLYTYSSLLAVYCWCSVNRQMDDCFQENVIHANTHQSLTERMIIPTIFWLLFWFTHPYLNIPYPKVSPLSSTMAAGREFRVNCFWRSI